MLAATSSSIIDNSHLGQAAQTPNTSSWSFGHGTTEHGTNLNPIFDPDRRDPQQNPILIWGVMPSFHQSAAVKFRE